MAKKGIIKFVKSSKGLIARNKQGLLAIVDWNYEYNNEEMLMTSEGAGSPDMDMFLPIVISPDESIKNDDIILYEGELWKVCIYREGSRHAWCFRLDRNSSLDCRIEFINKVLVLPEQISETVIQAIVRGELKDGDEVILDYKLGCVPEVCNCIDSGARGKDCRCNVPILESVTKASTPLYTEEEVYNLLDRFLSTIDHLLQKDVTKHLKIFWKQNKKK